MEEAKAPSDSTSQNKAENDKIDEIGKPADQVLLGKEFGENSKENSMDEIEQDEEDDEDVFATLAGFAADILTSIGTPAEPLEIEQRQPRPLSPNGHDLSYNIRLLQDLITYDAEEPEVSYRPEPLDTEGQIAAISHLLAAVVTTLEPRHLRRLASRMVSDTSLWISRLFRYFDSTAFLHEDGREGIVRVARMVLHHRYPKYATEGYEAVYARPPVIYTSTAVRPGLPQHIASQFGLGINCVRVVPCNTVIGSPVAMDTASLDRMMAEDVTAHRKPLLVIANAGGGVVGGVDNLSRIQELCCKYEAWIHVEGHALAALTLPNAPNLPAKVGDSMTLPLSTWLGIPSLPYVTLYRDYETAAVHTAGLTSLSLQVRLAALPLWMTLQTLGHNGVVSRFQHAFELSQHLQKHLAAMDHIRLLSPSPSLKEGTPSIQDLVTKPVSTSQLLDIACGTIVFQYVEDQTNPVKNSEYYDSLNSWLGQVVRRDVGSIPLELIPMESTGLVLRWSPLEGPQTQQISSEHIERFVHSLRHQIEILNATVAQRKTFSELVESASNLQLAEIPMWAGLGGVRYIPEIYAAQENLPQAARIEINRLNEHLVSQLRNTDSAFSLGEGNDHMNCVRFGMVTSETDISELLSLVISTGKDIETSSKFLSQMTEVVKKGIETATADLQRENDERLWQEGILRHVPLVSSVYNWLSPPPPPGIKGRTLDLTAGVLESTENIYRYHMQVRHGQTSNRTEAKLPPTPSVVTPVTPTPSTPTHSRSSSASTHSKQIDTKGEGHGADIASPKEEIKVNGTTPFPPSSTVPVPPKTELLSS
ncbi:Pyridoxal-dependent decarboxylase domain-containing protein 1 [Armadillidium vulgare]|nr:Pyridoxal-dependent decarboxylase domain-containing protein 1 [Armadillidium vulgare]